MLTADSPYSSHLAQNIILILLSIVFLPLDTFIIAVSYGLRFLFPTPAAASSPQSRKTILVTGVSMSKGLVLARLFAQSGHRVIGADFSPYACGRISRSLSAFYTVPAPTPSDSSPYISALLSVVKKENVDLWVSCSGVASAVDDGEAKEALEKAGCMAVQFGIRDTSILHEKDSFMNRTQELGLIIPETKRVANTQEAEEFLVREKKETDRRFIMKCVGMDDASRADMTLLPRSTVEETQKHIKRLRISERNPFIVQEFISGPEYCTHALVIKGLVKAFVACPSAELLMHYVALPEDSALSQAMLKFTRRYAESSGESFTGHLSFDFLVKKEDLHKQADEIRLYPIECNPRAHTAVVLFNQTPKMVDAYMKALEPTFVKGKRSNLNGGMEKAPIYPVNPQKYYWVGHDLGELVLLPLLHLVQGHASLDQVVANVQTFLGHLFLWHDGTYEIWDPLPWWWLYHVFWPMKFLDSLKSGRKWSRINVSTTKMFSVDSD